MTPHPPRSRIGPAARLTAGILALVLVAAAAGCGDDAGTDPAATTTTSAAGAATTSTAPVKRSAPRWETVTSFTGTSSLTTAAFPILPSAIQWRVRWACEAGHMKVTTDPVRKKTDPPTVDASCQGKNATGDKAVGYSIVTGNVKMVVDASGPWQITVDQQIDTPLIEPPLPGMATSKVLGKGDFYDVEMKGKGTARLYQLEDGSHALRFEDFEVSSNTDLFVWLSEAPAPKSSKDAVESPYVVLGNLKSTVGAENYVLPADLTPEKVKSIVIWCAPLRIAYTAAVLAPPS